MPRRPILPSQGFLLGFERGINHSERNKNPYWSQFTPPEQAGGRVRHTKGTVCVSQPPGWGDGLSSGRAVLTEPHIMEWFGLEGALKTPGSTPCHLCFHSLWKPCKAPFGFCSFITARLFQVTFLMLGQLVAAPQSEVSLHTGEPCIPHVFI